MSLSGDLVDRILTLPPDQAWQQVGLHAWSVCAAPMEQDPGAAAVARDRSLHALDLLLSGAAWDLWQHLAGSVPAASQALKDWWATHPPGRAVLLLDGLSLREVPWLLCQAEAHGIRVSKAGWRRAEIPGDTVRFARALGVPTRATLQNNGAGSAFALQPARTECTDMPFQDCAGLVGAEPDQVFWHPWPDQAVHQMAPAGKGLPQLALEARDKLAGPGFWALARRLAEGRRLVLTSDHGYAATGLFDDAAEAQGHYLRELFKSGRSSPDGGQPGRWLPPEDLVLASARLALGRRRWKCPGGYPTLAHGGLSVLEMLVPFLEMERMN